MAVIPRRVYGPAQPGITTGTLATVGANKRWIVKQIVMANTTLLSATITIGINGTAAANRIIPAAVVPSSGIVTLDCSIPLVAAETIDGLQGTASAITVVVAVIEEDV